MLIKAASAVTVADAKGEELDQGKMVRYLNEMMWFPSAFLEPNVSFRPLDSTSTEVTLSSHGREVTAGLSGMSEHVMKSDDMSQLRPGGRSPFSSGHT